MSCAAAMMMAEPSRTGETAKPQPKNMSHHFSEVTKARKPSKMKEYYKFFQIPGIGQFAGGLPHQSLFPFDTLEAQTARPDRWVPSPNYPGEAAEDSLAAQLAATGLTDDSKAGTAGKASDPTLVSSHIKIPKILNVEDPLRKIDVATALQYGQSNGFPPLLSFIRQFAREVLHPNVPYEGSVDVTLTCGATDGMSKTLEVFTNIWVEGKDDIRDRPGMVSDAFMYPNVQGQAMPRGVQIFPVEMDEGGMIAHGPGGLEDVLANWDYNKGLRPHLLYTVTMGHNPTGGVLSVERRRELYAICSKYDLIIIEDDPYYYLQYPSAVVEEAKTRGLPIPEPKVANPLEKKSGYAYIDSLTPSFLNIDTDGRVVRLDTFSKTVAPGCRAGWITAAPEIVERVVRVNESGTQHPSGFVEAMLAELLIGHQPEAAARFAMLRSPREQAAFSGWQMDGWVRWLAGLRGQYERRMNRLARTLDEGAFLLKQSSFVRSGGDSSTAAGDAEWGVITKTQLYDFAWPRGGMFLWLHMRFETHPLWQAVTPRGRRIDGTALSNALMIFLTHRPYLVLVSPGLMFSASPQIREARGWAYYRMCFAAETEQNVDACAARFVQGVHRFWRIKRTAELEDILDEIPMPNAAADAPLMNMASPFGC